MAANAVSNAALIAGRSHTSTRPASSCRVSSASNPGHSGPLGAAETGAWEADGDTAPAARRCSDARCRHPDPHQCGTRPRAATTTFLPHHPHPTTSGRTSPRSPRTPPSNPGTSHLPCQRLFPELSHLLHSGATPHAVETSVRIGEVLMDGETCPRCGGSVHWSGRGRRARWCSPACRRAAYEERRAAATGAIAVRIVQRETTREPSPAECVTRVLASPRACREVLNGLTTLADTRRRRRAGISCWHRQPCDRPMAH